MNKGKGEKTFLRADILGFRDYRAGPGFFEVRQYGCNLNDVGYERRQHRNRYDHSEYLEEEGQIIEADIKIDPEVYEEKRYDDEIAEEFRIDEKTELKTFHQCSDHIVVFHVNLLQSKRQYGTGPSFDAL